MSILKVHYFLWFGALAGIMPYVQIFAKTHNIASATSIGVLYFILPFVSFLTKPVFCSIADRYNCHKKALIISSILSLLGYGLLLSIPFINYGLLSWLWFCALVLLANTSAGIVISLTDSIVMKEVTETNRTYGSYRVYGSIGWGLLGLVAGIINEYADQYFNSILPYLIPGLIVFIIIELIDVICLWTTYKTVLKLDVENVLMNTEMKPNDEPKREVSWFYDNASKAMNAISQIFGRVIEISRKHPSIFQYTTIVTIFGILTAIHWSFYFWYIETINGKDPLLFGLCLFVQCFLGEIPFFMVSHKILAYCGPSISLNISLAAFAFRYFFYGYILEPGSSYLMIILIELTQGPTFGLFYCVMTSLAQHYAQKGDSYRSETVESRDLRVNSDVIEANESETTPKHDTHATMQAIMSACFEGFGLGIGSLMGGFIIDNSGIVSIWRYAAFLAVAAILFNLSIEIIKRIRQTRSLFQSINNS